MTNELLCKLYERISEEKILVFSVDTGNQKALTIRYDSEQKYGIFCNEQKFESNAEEFLIMAHEYGHCKSGATHKLCSPYQLIEQHEERANRAAVHELLPVEEIEEAVSAGNTTLWQIAECICMPEQFVSMAIEIYRLEGKLNR